MGGGFFTVVRVLFGSPRRAEPRSRRQDSAVERPIPSVSRTAMVTPAGLRLVPTLTTIETASPDGTPSGTTTFNSIIWREEKLLHVTDPLSQIGISVQGCWTGCSKTNDYQCGQQRILIRVLSEVESIRSLTLPIPAPQELPCECTGHS